MVMIHFNIRLVEVNGENVEGEEDGQWPEENEVHLCEDWPEAAHGFGCPLGFDGGDDSGDRPEEIQGDKYEHEPPVKVCPKVESGMRPECTEGDEPEGRVKESPVGKFPPGEPLEAFAQRNEKPDGEDSGEAVAADLFDLVISPELIDFIRK